jgi:hypothetical protein
MQPSSTLFLPFQRYYVPLLLIGLVLVSLGALARTVMKTEAPYSGGDLHPYWYYGHFVHVGINPYIAYAEKLELPGPYYYLNGSVTLPDEVDRPVMARAPAFTAPLLLILSTFSFFHWDLAKNIWLVCNVAFIIAIPWLTLRLLPPSLQLARPLQWLAAFSFYCMKGPRESAASGQASILVLLLMIGTLLLRQRHWIWAGVALGVALGKYSLALPILIFLLLEKRFQVIVVALLVQLLGLTVVAALDGGSLWETVLVNWRMIEFHAVQLGVHLGYLLRSEPQIAAWLVVMGSLITLAMVLYSRRRGWTSADLLPVNSVMILWILLAVYHRNYDTLAVIPSLILCLSAATTWQLPPRQSLGLGLAWLVVLFVMCLPGDAIGPFVTDEQVAQFKLWVERSLTLGVGAMWAVSLWLLPRTPRVNL